MGEVDPDDDTVHRWILYCYRFDPARHERRHCVIAAYDNSHEMRQRMDLEAQRLNERRASGVAEAAEYLTGSHMEPGHKDRAGEQRRAWKLWRQAHRNS